ncbi:von_Willebrand factor type A domain-containing protein [Hexamita inflata]|uniref:von Willebrand factor type A domain-containing protein n=1 Tax=Hexamita inflata TaxID=28002 RepID=A0AA86UGU7_9EUKA|nr:von Willebrand factor type A domain-containing protein [Hexamita inflata]
MNNNYMEVVALLDMSGSMQNVAADTIGGFNAYLQELAESEMNVNITLIVFNTWSQTVLSHQNVKQCNKLTNLTYKPNGSTCVPDALANAIKSMRKYIQLQSSNEKPKVSFFLSTDGEKNAMGQFSRKYVKKMVTKAIENDKWEFIFAGSNIDAFDIGQQLGFKTDSITNVDNDGIGQKALYEVVAQKQTTLQVSPDIQDLYTQSITALRK